MTGRIGCQGSDAKFCGCVHIKASVKKIWQTAISLGVAVRNNTNGKLPYPYKPQGVVSVFTVKE